MKRIHVLAGLAALTLALGCGGPGEGTPRGDPKGKPTPKEEVEDHSHGAGPHGGTVADWGGGKYHIEFTVDHNKQEATVYLLKADAKTPAPIGADKLLLTIKEPSFQVELKALPQKGDPKGKASRFAGKHARLGKEQEFAGTVSGEVNGTPYAGDFKEEPEAPGKDKK